MPSSATTKRVAHRGALVAAALWWGYAFFSTSFFTNLSGTGLVAYLGVRGIAWVIATFRS